MAALSILLTVKAALKPVPAFLHWLGSLTSIAEAGVCLMPRSLGLSVGSSGGIVGRGHDGLACFARFPAV
jgi:hypothetical protein